ncbi:MAG: AsmA family protein [Steroidobacteraceae bacterium]|nr:AsmA family protein [Steroidobacteraceae bacterium]
MRIGRWVIGIVAGLVLLAVLTVLAVTVFVDPNRYRGQIEAAVTRATGQPFNIEGDLEIAWYPWLAVRMGPSQFGAPGAGGEPLVRWKSARVGARLVPLIRGELIIDRVRLDEPRFVLRRDAAGRGNWEDVFAALKKPPTPPITGPNPPPGPQIAGFEIQDGALTYVDEARGRHFTITDWQLDVGAWRSGATVPVATEFAWEAEHDARDKTPIGVRLSATARVHVSDDANDIDVFELVSTSRVQGGPLPKAGVPVSMRLSRFAARLSPLDIAISEVAARVGDADVTASIQAGESGPGLYVRGPLSVELPSLRRFLPTLGAKVPLPVDKTTIGPMKLASMWEWNNGAVRVSGIDLHLDDTHFTGELSRTSSEDAVWTFALHGDKIDLSRYLEIEKTSKKPFELPLAALRALKMQGELTFDQASVADAEMKDVRMRFELADGAVKSLQ